MKPNTHAYAAAQHAAAAYQPESDHARLADNATEALLHTETEHVQESLRVCLARYQVAFESGTRRELQAAHTHLVWAHLAAAHTHAALAHLHETAQEAADATYSAHSGLVVADPLRDCPPAAYAHDRQAYEHALHHEAKRAAEAHLAVAAALEAELPANED